MLDYIPEGKRTRFCVKLGMSEVETLLAIDHNVHPDRATEGDCTVIHNQDGKAWTAMFVRNRRQ